MTDEQFRELRNYILDLKVEIAELKLALKKQNEMADHRFSLLYDWCAPSGYKMAVDSVHSEPDQSLEDFLAKLGR
jgi:hypothetical protein